MNFTPMSFKHLADNLHFDLHTYALSISKQIKFKESTDNVYNVIENKMLNVLYNNLYNGINKDIENGLNKKKITAR